MLKVERLKEKIKKIVKWVVAAFFASTILVVVWYKFVPVWVTPLMVIRSVQMVGEGEWPKMHHSWTSIENMPKALPVAVMASEDQRFLVHHGFDFSAIEKAAKHNMHSKKKHGASTISQQTAKNVFLWPGRSWVRKGFEMYFTVLIEFVWGKERIMEVYLNSIEMGDGIYGAKAVAQYNFDKEVEDLSRKDCALIAATLPNPRKFSSKDPSGYMIKRRGQILHQMKFVGWPYGGREN